MRRTERLVFGPRDGRDRRATACHIRQTVTGMAAFDPRVERGLYFFVSADRIASGLPFVFPQVLHTPDRQYKSS